MLEGMNLSAAAQAPYTPQVGSADRTAVMDALRAGLKTFPDFAGSGFSYKRNDVRPPADMPVRFIVRHLKIKEPWAWAEVDVKDYCCAPLHALLCREKGEWTVKGIVNPLYVVCPDSGGRAPVVQEFIYGEFRKKFPSVPKELFPEIPAEVSTVLKDIEKHVEPDGPWVYFVRYFKRKDDWAWVHVEPRSEDGQSILEPLQCLVHKESDRWVAKAVTPCCDECAADPDCAAGKYHRKVMQWFPQAPKEIFPPK